MKHAPLGSSTCHVWKNCPGSGHLCAVAPTFETEPMRRGTMLHEIAEKRLRGMLDTQELNEEDYTIVQEYYLSACELAKGKNYEIEARVNLVDNICFGTADFIVYDAEDAVTVCDFKTGKTKVSPVSNDQLKFLSLAFMDRKIFQHVIIQPRVYKEPQIYECPLDEMKEFAQQITTVVEEFQQTPAPLRCGKWCSKCKAKSFCPEKNKVASMPQQIEPAW